MLIFTVIGIILALSIVSNYNTINDTGNNDENIKFRDETLLKTANSEITIITPENKTYTEPMSGYYPATYGFENNEIGSDPEEFSVTETAGSIEVINELDGHHNIVELYDTDGADRVRMENHFDQTYGTIEYWVRTDNVQKTSTFILNGAGGGGSYTDIIQFYIRNGEWQYRPAGPNYFQINVGNPQNNTWHRITIHFRCNGAPSYQGLPGGGVANWRVIIDGVNSGTLSARADGRAYTTFVRWESDNVHTDYHTYIDAVGYSWDDNYNIGNNLKEGLLLSFENSTTLDWMGYSLDGQNNNTILGNTTIRMPKGGHHTIQVFGNNSLGYTYQSNVRYFINYLDLTGSPIFIDGDATGVGAHNWTWVEQQVWFGGGDGSQGTPYIIEYITINGQGSGSCIFIRDSNKYFIVRNCKVYSAGSGTYDAGIKLQNTDNGTLTNNDCSNNLYYGILLYLGCHDNTVLGNTIYSNNKYGIRLEDTCSKNTILENTISYNDQQEISLFRDCAHNTISGNTLKCCDTYYGIYIESNCWRNTISGNTLSACGFPDREGGIYLDGTCWDNLFYLNYFLDAADLIRDEGFGNQWDNGTIGNYWEGYMGEDANNDGIGDTPYEVTWPTIFDNFPIWDEHDPIITIHSPADDEKVGRNAPSFNVTIYDPWLDTMWYTVNGGMNNRSFIHNETIDQTSWENQWDLLSNGAPIVIMFYANDTFGHMSNENVTVFKYVPTTPSGNGGGGGGGDDDDKEGEAIPGYNVFILIGIINVITIILIKRRYK